MHGYWAKGALLTVVFWAFVLLPPAIAAYALGADVASDSPAQPQHAEGSAGDLSSSDVQHSGGRTQAAGLVARLGHSSWQERSKAAAALTALGAKAVPAVRNGLQHPDPHVRRQCRQLLLDILEADCERRLAAFIAGKEDALESPLPGWQAFSRLVGSDALSRQLFADMYRAESPVLEMLETKPKEAGELVFSRLNDIGTARGLGVPQLPRGTDVEAFFRGLSGLQALSTDVPRMAVLLFVLTHPEVHPHLHHNTARIGVMRGITSALASKACVDHVGGHKYRRPMQRLLRLWLETPEHIEILPQKVALIEKYALEEALPWALEVVLTCQRDELPPGGHFRQQLVMEATRALALVGGKKHAAALERLLECDEAVVSVPGRQPATGWSVQIRDIALAWLVYVTEQDFEQYGLRQAKTAFEQIRKNPQHNLPIQSLSLDEQSRAKALARWAAYAAESPLPPLPAEYKTQPAKVAILPPFSAVPPSSAQPPRRATVEPQGPAVVLAERSTISLLKGAEELLARRDYAGVVDILLRIMSDPHSAAFQPETGLGLFRFTKTDALRLIRTLPAEGLRVMRLHCSDLARHELNAALETANQAALEAVAEKYPGTQSGNEAAMLTALAALSRGRALQAATILDRLRREVPDADRLEPELSLWLATCWLRAGRPDEAHRVLAALAQYKGREVSVLGAPARLLERPDAALAWLQKHFGPAKAAANPVQVFAHQVEAEPAGSGTPHLMGQLLMPLIADGEIAQWLQQTRQADALECRPTVPRITPLVVGRTAVARTLTHIAAVDLDSGELLWENPLNDALGELLDRRRLGRSELPPELLLPQALSSVLRRRVWEDAIFGAITSNGRYVFGVEDLPCGLGPQYRRTVIDANGMRRWESEPARRTANVLTAYDIGTGKLVWEIGGPADSWQPAAGAFFLGPPLALGNSLFVLADIEEEIRLLELHADSGALLGETVLASRLKPAGSTLWPMPYRPSDALRRQGATPAFSDGVLVCQTSEHDFAAIDLATRDLLWLHTLPEDETSPSRRQLLLGGRLIDSAQAAPQSGVWLDSGVVLACGVAIIAPAHGNRLLAIGLRDGRLLWTAPRRDALFVGAADGQRVVLVGRSGLRAIKLADGTPAWPVELLPLPAGAAPGGRGLLADGRFHLPLSTGGLLIVDMHTGQQIAVCRMWEDSTPGSLVAFPDGIVSTNVEGLMRFRPLSTQLQRLEAALEQRPDDADLLAEYAAALIADNRPAEALEHLLRSLTLRPSQTARLLLVDAISQGLRTDFDGFSKLVPRARPLLEKTDQFQPAMLAWANALREHGEIRSALEVYLAVAAAETKPGEYLPAEALRRVRRDRLWAAQLAATYAAAEPSQRKALDELIAAELRNPQMIAYLGWHKAAHRVRLQLARQMTGQPSLRAELLLRQVLAGGEPEEQRAAAALLASLLRDSGEILEAAELYRFLLERWSGEVCLDGKTGRELVELLPADDPLRKLVAAPHTWPAGKVYVEALAGSRQAASASQAWVTVVPVDASPGKTVSHALVDSSSGLTLVDSQGRQRAKWQPERTPGMIYSPSLYPMYSQLYTVGRLVFAFVGNRLTVLQVGQDLPEGTRTLWSRPVSGEQQFGLGAIWVGNRGAGLFAMPASAGLPVAVSLEAVWLLGDRKLTALDPISGEVLWVRDDMPAGSGLFGDQRHLVVASTDGSQAEVLDVLDGRTIARGTVPPADQRMLTLGTQVVAWEAAQNSAMLGLYDPLEGKYLWQRKYQSRPKAWPISQQEVAVCDEQGRLEIVALPSGRLLCAAQLDSPPHLRDLVVHKAFGQYVAIVNHGFAAATSAIGNTIPVEGMAYGIDAASGMLRWSAQLSQCGFRPGGPTDIPLLVFELSSVVRQGNAFRQLTRLMCIDKRDGQVLVDREFAGRALQVYQIDSDPEGRRIEVLGQNETFRFHFTDEPHSPHGGGAK